MSAALLFLALAAAFFIVWMAIGSKWVIWAFVFVTLVLAIDATHPGIAGRPILPIALTDGG